MLGSPYFRGKHLTCFWDISLTVVLSTWGKKEKIVNYVVISYSE